MQHKKLLKQLVAIFDMKKRKRCNHRNEIKQILARLREKEMALLAKASEEKDPNQGEKLRLRAKVIHRQRFNGLKKLKNMDC
jgi:hypothetical protein